MDAVNNEILNLIHQAWGEGSMSRRDHIKNLYESTAESEKLAMANSPKPPAHPAGDRLSRGAACVPWG